MMGLHFQKRSSLGSPWIFTLLGLTLHPTPCLLVFFILWTTHTYKVNLHIWLGFLLSALVLLYHKVMHTAVLYTKALNVKQPFLQMICWCLGPIYWTAYTVHLQARPWKPMSRSCRCIFLMPEEDCSALSLIQQSISKFNALCASAFSKPTVT